MTHFVGAVVVPPSIPAEFSTTPTKHPALYGADAKEWQASPEVTAYLEAALARFDEDFDVPRYQEASRAQLIETGRKDIEAYRDGLYAKYLADPTTYEADCRNPSHLAYLRDEFPTHLTWTDEQVYADAIKFYEPDEIEADGSVWSTRNPEGNYDWWVIGGRWEKEYAESQGESLEKFRAMVAGVAEALAAGDPLRPEPTEGPMEDPERKLPWWYPQNIVIPKGDGFEWIRAGRVGWFGMRDDDMTESEWLTRLLEVTADLDPASTIVYLDFHI